MAELTPMMKQYLEIKKDNPDSILFFRLGDFYEMFADDAKLASKELDLTLTSRDHGKNAKPAEERVPMCGIPYHARSNPHFLFLLRKRKRPFMVKRKDAEGRFDTSVSNHPKRGLVVTHCRLNPEVSYWLRR